MNLDFFALFLLVNWIHLGYTATVPNKDDTFNINVTMKSYGTKTEDEYAFVQYQLPDEELMIVGYSPLTNMKAAHHMLTYACAAPASRQPFWTGGGPCAGEQMIIHGWARNAPAMNLPDDVGFAVGRNTPYKYIVVNIHYFSIIQNDNSGNQLIMSRTPRKYHAGVMLGGTGNIFLPRHSHTVRTPFSCHYQGAPVTIFAARVHAHQWARVNSLYRVRDGKISQVVKGDPQWPQSFYPLTSPAHIEKDDYLIGQCVYDSDEDRTIYAGSTHNDEMCNVYAMYSFEPTKNGQSPLSNCWGDTHPQVSRLIPDDSIVPPLKPADISVTNNGQHLHAEHAMNASPANVYTNVETWPNTKSLPKELGQIGGIALTNKNDELVVFSRGSRKWESQLFNGVRFRNDVYGPIKENVLLHVDTRTGETKYQWGANMFYMPHGITIDSEGNFWLTDVAMHQVFMFKPDDLVHPALTVGEMFVSGSGPNQLCRPADVAVMKNGDFFVADGYCNSRIIKFNRKGEYLTEWGSPVSGKTDKDGFPLANEWNIVHSIALNEESQLICGADRENFRIQCFNLQTGDFIRQIRVEKDQNIGAIYAIEFAPNANGSVLFAVTGGQQTANKKVYMIDAKTGDILTSFESKPKLDAPHDIAISANAREVYVGELATSPETALHKFELVQQKELPTQTFIKKIYNNDRNFRISLIIMAVFAVPVFLAVIIGCCIRIRNMRQTSHLNRFLKEVKTGGGNGNSVLGDWKNRRQGFERLEQYSDGENEPFDTSLNEENSADETINVATKVPVASFNQKNISTNFKMGESL